MPTTERLKIVDYKLIAEQKDMFDIVINALISQNYEPYGPPSIITIGCNTRFCQVMVLYKYVLEE
jgi:hypothetical protein